MASRQLSHANGQAQQTQGLAVITAPLKSPESLPKANPMPPGAVPSGLGLDLQLKAPTQHLACMALLIRQLR